MHYFSLLLKVRDQVLEADNFSSRKLLHVLQVFSLDLAATLLYFSHVCNVIKHLFCLTFHQLFIILCESSRETLELEAGLVVLVDAAS